MGGLAHKLILKHEESIKMKLIFFFAFAKGQSTDDQTMGLAQHNLYRAKHGSPDLVMSDELNQQASAYAEVIAQRGSMAHADNLQELGQGENLAYSWSSTGPVI